jgi:hypothetical protein
MGLDIIFSNFKNNQKKTILISPLVLFFLILISCEKGDLKRSYISNVHKERLGELIKENVVTINISHDDPTIVEIDSTAEDSLLVQPEIFGQISDITFDNQFIYITDQKKHQLVRYNINSGVFKTIGQQGRGPSDFNKPVLVEKGADHLFIFEANNDRIQVIDRDLKSVATFDAPGFGGFNVNKQYILVPWPDLFSIDGKVVNVFQNSRDFKRIDRSLLPVITNPGTGSPGDNVTAIATSAAQQFYIYYYGLPFIFVYDEKLNHKRTIEITGEIIRDFYENVPERIINHPEPEMLTRQLIIGLAVSDQFLFFQISGVLYQVDIDSLEIINRYRFKMNDQIVSFIKIKSHSDKLYFFDGFNDRIFQAEIDQKKTVQHAKFILQSYSEK